MATYPQQGDGIDCDPSLDDCGVARDAVLEVRFDRPLLPSTAVRQSLSVHPAGSTGSVFFRPEYDVLERVVTFVPEDGTLWEPGLLYEVELRLPADEGFGFRAYDGAALVEEGSVPLRFSFRTARVDPGPSPPAAAPPTCLDARSVFGSGGCLECHAGAEAPMGLQLDSAAALTETAIGRVAHAADTGSVAGRILVNPGRFGSGMAIISPGDPSSSYLLYKVLTNRANYGADGCASIHRAPLPAGECLSPSAAEVERMRSWFLPLDPMPPTPQSSLTTAGLRTLQGFIRAGASVDGCP